MRESGRTGGSPLVTAAIARAGRGVLVGGAMRQGVQCKAQQLYEAASGGHDSNSNSHSTRQHYRYSKTSG
jgi:hypothetical protein